MAYSYKSSISFGLVYIPVTLHSVIKNNDIGFNMLDKKTQSRVQYKKTCVDCGNREVKQDDIIKGYQYQKDKYVIFEESDFEKLKTKKDKTITIKQFVDLNKIDPVYYDKAYYIKPEGADRAYALLLEAMQKESKVGIAKTMLGSKETLIAIRVKNGEMILSTMFFEEEVQKSPVKELNANVNVKELDMAVTIINSMTAEFNPKDYKDEYKERLASAIETKISGKEIVALDNGGEKSITDLMEALQSSINNIGKSKITPMPKAKPINKSRQSVTSKSAIKTPNKSITKRKPTTKHKKAQ